MFLKENEKGLMYLYTIIINNRHYMTTDHDLAKSFSKRFGGKVFPTTWTAKLPTPKIVYING